MVGWRTALAVIVYSSAILGVFPFKILEFASHFYQSGFGVLAPVILLYALLLLISVPLALTLPRSGNLTLIWTITAWVSIFLFGVVWFLALAFTHGSPDGTVIFLRCIHLVSLLLFCLFLRRGSAVGAISFALPPIAVSVWSLVAAWLLMLGPEELSGTDFDMFVAGGPRANYTEAFNWLDVRGLSFAARHDSVGLPITLHAASIGSDGTVYFWSKTAMRWDLLPDLHRLHDDF